MGGLFQNIKRETEEEDNNKDLPNKTIDEILEERIELIRQSIKRDEEQLKQLCRPGDYTIKELEHIKEQGGNLIAKIIDQEILIKLIEGAR